MVYTKLVPVICAALVMPLFAADADIEKRIQNLKDLKIENGTIDSVEYDAEAKPPCTKVKATLKPAPESNIKVEVWLPDPAKWNKKFFGSGNGGPGGKIHSDSFHWSTGEGFAVAGTNMGTTPDGLNGVNNREVWKDFGYRATHLMTVIAKEIVKAFYGEAPTYSYFRGDSTGGQQALQLAQRNPEDYDGIIAGVPANYRTHIHAYFLWLDNIWREAQFTKEQEDAVVAASKEYKSPKDLPEDLMGKVVIDPRGTEEDVEAVIALARKKDPSLTDAHAAALRKLYQGPRHAETGEIIMGGTPIGGSFFRDIAFHHYPLKWAFPGKKPEEINFGADMDFFISTMGPYLDAVSPDLSAFAKRGGKLIMVAGARDALIPYHNAIDYYERVIEHFSGSGGSGGSEEGLKKVQGFFRFYLVPDMGHNGGAAVNRNTVMKWREEGIAPEEITGMHKIPVPPYPAEPFWDKESSTWKSVPGPRTKNVPRPAARFLTAPLAAE